MGRNTLAVMDVTADAGGLGQDTSLLHEGKAKMVHHVIGDLHRAFQRLSEGDSMAKWRIILFATLNMKERERGRRERENRQKEIKTGQEREERGERE